MPITRSMRPVTIAGTGSCLPDQVVTTEELIKKYRMDTTVEWVHHKLGIKTRRYAAPDQQTSDLGATAARRALDMAGIHPKELGGIIVALGIGDHRAPATACYLQEKIGAPNAYAIDIDSACAGFVVGLETARRFVQDGGMKAFLVVGADVASRTKVDPADRTLGLIFGDGAGAAVVAPCKDGEGWQAGYLRSDGAETEVIGIRAGGSVCPITPDAVAAGHHWIKMDGPGVWRVAVKALPESIRAVCTEAGVKPQDLDFIVTHQANLRLIEEVFKTFDLPMTRTHTTVEKYGNTSSASVGLTTDEALRMGKFKPGDLVCLTAVGAGFTWGASLLRWTCKA